ncbi:MAG TPA: STAS domain-containing protein [Candidatus Sulfotelmatobacter sp.]|nr:STAS domain-containing protein [Candidatus Sulfotelmatobacter sp.]
MAASSLPSAPELSLKTEKTKLGEALVHGTGRITAENADTLQVTVRQLIPDCKLIVLDLTGIDYIDSSGLGALVGLYLAAARVNCQLELSNPKPRVRDLLKISKITTVFEGHEFGGI